MNKLLEIDYSILDSVSELLDLLHNKKIPNTEYWKYLDKYREEKARERGIPLHGMFELTPLCNLDCKMCYVHLCQEQLYGHKLLNVDQWKSIIKQAHEMGMVNATLTGGECLTYPCFDEIYLYLRSLGIKTSIKTNGLLLDDEKFNFFREYSPASIIVSVYGSSNETYERVTGYAVFDQVYENLLRLKKARYSVSLSITPSIYLYEDVPKIVELAKKLGFSYMINISLFTPRTETGRKLSDLSKEQYLQLFKMLSDNKAESTQSLKNFEMNEYKRNDSRKVGVPCGAGRSSFNIDWKGQLKGCENLNSLQVSVIDKPFSVAWKQIHQDAITFPLPIECDQCAYDKVCYGCVAYRTKDVNPGHCNPEVCARTKLMVSNGFYRL